MNKMIYRLMSVIVAFGLALGVYYSAGASSASATSISANTYYVSVTGNDANAGTQAQPWKTIQKAVNTSANGDRIIVSGGNYSAFSFSNRTIECIPARSCIVTGGGVIDMMGNATLRGFVVDGGTVFAGINMYDGNNLAENNEVRNMMQCPVGQSPGSGGCPSWADADGFRFFGTGNVMRGNYIHDNSYTNGQNDGSSSPPHIDCFQTWSDSSNHDPAVNTIIEYNICDQYSALQSLGNGTSGVELDNASGTIFRHNVIHVYDKKLDLDNGNSNTLMENNIFLGGANISGLTQWGILVSNGTNTSIKNNLFYGIIHGQPNIYFKNSGDRGVISGNKEEVNPMLDSTFHPLAGSPVCGAGTNGSDIGAYPCGGAIPPTAAATNSPTKTPTVTATNMPNNTPTVTATNTPTSVPTYTPFSPTPVSASPTPTLLPPTPTATASPIPVVPTATQTSISTATSTATLQPTSPILLPAVPTTAPAGINSVDVRVVKGENDVEESSRGKIYINSTNLELVYDTSTQKVGLRFTDVSIPQGATIVNAYIQFKVGKVSTNGTTLSIQGDASANAPAFASTTRNISSRSKTTRVVNWSPSSWSTVGAVGSAQLTPNLAPIIQEIISKPGWAPGNPIVIIITGSGKRVAKAYEGDAAGAPLLHIEYTTNMVVSNIPAPLAMAAVVSTELPTALPVTATPVSTLTATFQPPSPTIPVTFTSTVPPAPLLLPSLTPTSLAPVLPTFTPTTESINTMSVVNEHPVITSNGVLSIAENTTAVTTVTATDADLPAQTLTYSIAGGADSALFSINSSTGELTYITAPDYEVPADAGIDNIYNVTVQTSDGALAATQDITVIVTALNDNNPVITSNGVLSIAENTTAVAIVTATDADLPAQTLTYSISGGADSTLFSINPSTGDLTFITAPDFEVPADASGDHIYSVTVQASDGELTVTQDITVTVTAVNDNNPVITSNGVLSIAENATTVTTVTATDADLPAQTLTYSISGGADSALFSINSSTGELTYITAPDYEIPTDAGIDNIYNVTVQTSDGELTATQDIAVAVTALNDNSPVITSNGVLSIAENTTAVTTVTATDADLPAQPLTYSISGGSDSALFNINSSTGELTFITAPDYEIPTDAGIDNIYNVTVQTSDGALAATQDITVIVTALNDNSPAITSNGVLSIAENAMTVTTVTATDADLPAQALAYSISGGSDSALFNINSSTGELTSITAPDYEIPTDAGIDNIYNVTVQTSDGELTATQDISITVTAFNDNNPVITSDGNLSIAENTAAVTIVTATDADLPAQALAYSISGGADSALFSINPSTGELTFISTPDFEVPTDAGIDNIYNVTVQASDGALAATQDIAITVTALNDNNPVITSNGNLSIAENTPTVTTVTATDTDLPTQTLTYSIAGGADLALFSINSSTGDLTFITAPDYEVPADVGSDNIYNVTVQASDGSLTATQNITVTVKGAD
jgi:pyrimidine deaminase RibD-like protein